MSYRVGSQGNLLPWELGPQLSEGVSMTCRWKKEISNERGTILGFPLAPANAGDARDTGSILGLGRCPGEGNGTPLQYSCLENSMDRGAWWATAHGVAKSQTRLSTHPHRGTISVPQPRFLWAQSEMRELVWPEDLNT